jgi:hypothetical protein
LGIPRINFFHGIGSKYQDLVLWNGNDRVAKELGLSKREFEAILTRQYKQRHPEANDDVECYIEDEY